MEKKMETTIMGYIGYRIWGIWKLADLAMFSFGPGPRVSSARRRVPSPGVDGFPDSRRLEESAWPLHVNQSQLWLLFSYGHTIPHVSGAAWKS